MYFSPCLAASALALITTFSAASPLQARNSTPAPGQTHSSEFVTLGCPKTTKPFASVAEQLNAANDFAQQLFVKKQMSKAFNTYIATDLINHAYDVPCGGSAIAQSVLGETLSAAKFDIKWVNVGQDLATTFLKITTPMGVLASTETFRLSGTCFVEHWIIAQPVTNSSNPHAFF